MRKFQILFRIIGIPLLIIVYIVLIIPLIVRDLAQCVCKIGDDIFDYIAYCCGLDTSSWPIPKYSDITSDSSFYKGK